MTREKSGASPGGAVADVREKGAEIASAGKQQVEEKAGELRDEAAFQLREQVDQRSTQAGEQVEAFGQALSSGANQLRSEGKATSARFADEAAQRVDDLGSYLKSADADRIINDLESFARQRPWLTAGVGVLAGFVASRFVKASSERRYHGAYGNGRPATSPTYPPRRSLPTGGGTG